MKLISDIIKLWFSLMLKNTNSSCDKVLLSVFIECTVNKRFKALKKYRLIPTSKTALKMAWSKLFEAYCIQSNNPGYELFYDQMRKVYRLDSKILSINSCIQTLTLQYDQQSVDILRSFGYNYKFNYEHKNQFIEDLNRVINKSKTLIIEREREKLRFESSIKSNKKEEVSIDYFQASLTTLSKYMGYRLDPKQITVSEFCSITAGYEKEIQLLMSKNQ